MRPVGGAPLTDFPDGRPVERRAVRAGGAMERQPPGRHRSRVRVPRGGDRLGRLRLRIGRRIGRFGEHDCAEPPLDPEAIAALLHEQVDPAELLPRGLAGRLAYAGIDLPGGWLDALLTGRRDLDLAPATVAQAAIGALSWDERQWLDRLAPREFVSPAGTTNPIDYAAPAGPTVELRVQALFGLDVHPIIGDPPRPLLLSLTSPAGRPIQTTADLPGFWRGSWLDVAREMKGRYPKHRWPEQPWLEKPSLKTRNAFQRAEN